MFHAGSDRDTNSIILNLLMTGVLNQESRLQEVERKVANLGTTQGGIQTWRGPTALSQQTLDLETRVSHLEEDLRDYKSTTHHQLEVVRTDLKELQRMESEDMRGMHRELSDDVEDLDGKVNNSINHTGHEMRVVNNKLDTVEGEVGTNTDNYHRLRSWLHEVIWAIRNVETKLGDDIHELKGKVADISKTLDEMEKEEDNKEQQPAVGNTGGIQNYPLGVGTQVRGEDAPSGWVPAYSQYNYNANMQSVERKPATLDELLHGAMQARTEEPPSDWMYAYPNTNANRQSVERKPASLQELLHELDNYNM